MGTINRRSMILGSAGAVAGAAAGVGLASGAPAGADDKGKTVSDSLKVVDNRGRQRLLMDTKKPPIIADGKVYPPELRGGPDELSCIVFNDENGNEKGAIAAYSTGAILSLDYANTDAIHLETGWQGKSGGAQLQLRQMPDPTIPRDQLKPRLGAQLFTSTEQGSGLLLLDPEGRPRIRLQVTKEGTPSIAILDEQGAVVKQL